MKMVDVRKDTIFDSLRLIARASAHKNRNVISSQMASLLSRSQLKFQLPATIALACMIAYCQSVIEPTVKFLNNNAILENDAFNYMFRNEKYENEKYENVYENGEKKIGALKRKQN